MLSEDEIARLLPKEMKDYKDRAYVNSMNAEADRQYKEFGYPNTEIKRYHTSWRDYQVENDVVP